MNKEELTKKTFDELVINSQIAIKDDIFIILARTHNKNQYFYTLYNLDREKPNRVISLYLDDFIKNIDKIKIVDNIID